jgi:hypothetical protein
VIGLCLGLAGVVWAQVPTADFTLAWTHTIEKIRWEEDYRVTPDGLLLGEARVKGSGAGMEIPDDAELRDGAWHYQRQMPPLSRLERMARPAKSGPARAGTLELRRAGGGLLTYGLHGLAVM